MLRIMSAHNKFAFQRKGWVCWDKFINQLCLASLNFDLGCFGFLRVCEFPGAAVTNYHKRAA